MESVCEAGGDDMDAERHHAAIVGGGASIRSVDDEFSAAARYRAEHLPLWSSYSRKPASIGYYRRLAEIYRFLVPRGSRVLELGCGTGDLLAALQPDFGVGVDVTPEMVRQAARKHPHL